MLCSKIKLWLTLYYSSKSLLLSVTTRLPDLTCHKKCPLYSWPFNYTLLSLFIYWIALILHGAWRQSFSCALSLCLCLISRCPPFCFSAQNPSHGSRELLVWTTTEMERRVILVSERERGSERNRRKWNRDVWRVMHWSVTKVEEK